MDEVMRSLVCFIEKPSFIMLSIFIELLSIAID